jgi:cell division protein FtsB
MKRIIKFFKKFWWIIAIAVAFIFGMSLRKKEENPDVKLLKKQRKDLQKEQEALKEEQKKLEKEAEQIEKEKPFTDADSAAKFLNNIARRKR